jgi:hypothetical protein
VDQRLKTILDGIGDAEFSAIAAGALGTKQARLLGPAEFIELTAPHFDRKTIGIVRASGQARAEDGAIVQPWSTVAKISDLSLAPNEGDFTHVEDEATVYEQRLFTGDGQRFRPARCYAISRPTPSIRVLWLEDLTDAKGSPFDVSTLTTILRHLGEWNGHHAVHQTTMSLPVRRDGFAARWHATGFASRLKELPDFADAPNWRVAFGDLPSSIVLELYGLIDRLVAQTAMLPHAVAFGDLGAGNVFLKGDEAVAVDWASLTVDPVGVDGGCLAGSPLTYARGATIAAAEIELFEAYLEGLHEAGWAGNRDDVRRAYLCLYGIYQLYCGLMPVFCGKLQPFPRAFIEGRFGTSLEEVPELVAGVIRRFPATINELNHLLPSR